MATSIFDPTTFPNQQWEKGVWERGTFTVPDDVPDSRVQSVAHKYMGRFGEALERQGFEVLETLGPIISQGRMPAEPGRKRYDCFARARRRPVIIDLEIPEVLIPEMQSKGLKLK